MPVEFGGGYFGYGAFGAGSDDLPCFVDEVAFASNPFDVTQIWTELTDRTRLRSWRRGRQTENDVPETGTATANFDNSDRALDSANAASPYYPNILGMRRIRCRTTVDGVDYYLYTCFVDPQYGWQLQQTDPAYSEAIAAANDGFDILSTEQFTASDSFPEQTPGARINAILDRFGWPAAERAIDVTSTQVPIQARPAGSLAGRSALEEIQLTALTEDGIFFIDGRGYAVFHDRYHALLDDRAITSQATFTDTANYGPGDFLYESLKPVTSPIINDYLVTREGGSQVEAFDQPSIDLYRPRSTSLSTLHKTDAEALDFANYKLASTKDPHRRYDEMVLNPVADPDMWKLILQLGIGDRITVKQSPPGGGAPDVRDMHIEAISATVGPTTEASVTYRLSPASQLVGWYLVPDGADPHAGQSQLGSTTVLVY